MHKGYEGDVNLPKPQANWRFPPDPYSHPEIKRRDWSLREKADSQEWEVMGHGEREALPATWLSSGPGRWVRVH